MERNRYKYLLIAIVLFFGMQVNVSAQENTDNSEESFNRPLVYRSDTVPMMMIPAVNIYDVNKYNYLKSRRYRRDVRNVKKAYPYAIIANQRLKSLDNDLAQFDSKKEQKEYLEVKEKEIIREFEGEMRKLNITQGIILVKLIDRETGQTSYEVVKDLRGGFNAFFWQGIARIIGNDLKLQFDPDGEDQLIEDIVMAIEYGFI